jgi:hypothetical protein
MILIDLFGSFWLGGINHAYEVFGVLVKKLNAWVGDYRFRS